MMSAEPLPQDVQAILRTHIESYEHLSILLFVHRESARHWSEAQLSCELRIPAPLAATALGSLQDAGLISVESKAGLLRYKYAATGATDATIARLASEYLENPVRIVKFMSANAIERVRTSALRAFADAFLLKKDKDGG